MMLRLAGGKEEHPSDLVFISVAATAVSSIVFAAGVAACLVMFRRSDIAAAAALYLVLWQLQDVLRRALLAEFRHRTAAVSDGITYMGAAGALAVLASYSNLSLLTALWAMSGACAFAVVIQIAQRRTLFPRTRDLLRFVRDFWTVGQWAFLNGLLIIGAVQIFPWALAILDGPAAAAGFQAVMNIANLANPIVFGLCNIIGPAAARAHAEGDLQTAWKTSQTYIGIGAILLSLYVIPVALMPRTTLLLFYGADSPYANLHQAVSIVVVAVALNSIVDMVSAFINGVRAAKLAFGMNSISLVAAALMLPITAAMGVAGCALALGVSKFVRLMVAWHTVARMVHAESRFPWSYFRKTATGEGK